MNNSRNNSLIPPVILFVVFVAYTFIVTMVDVKSIGPYDTNVGLGTINKAFADGIGVHMIWYHITNILGLFSLLVAAFFAGVGVLQLVTRKSLAKVDKDIIILGGFYIVVLACYMLFDKFAINYRPVMLDGELESSYPSSHTMLAICVMSTAIMQLRWKIKDKQLRQIISGVLAFLILVIVVGRLLSGVHWFTDIIGGIFLSAVLVSLYHWFVMEAGGPGPLKAHVPARAARSSAARAQSAHQTSRGYSRPSGSYASSGAHPTYGSRTSGTHASGSHASGAHPSGSRVSGAHPSYGTRPSESHGSGSYASGSHASRRGSTGPAYPEDPMLSRRPTGPSYPEDPTLARRPSGSTRSTHKTLEDNTGSTRGTNKTARRGKSHGRLDR